MFDEKTYPESSALYQQAKKVLPGGNTRTTVFQKPFPLYAQRGEGCYIWDVDGNKRIDCINNFTAMIHGHAHPRITSTVARQLEHGTCFGMPTGAEIQLAAELINRLPSVEQVRFANSGTEAVMMAIKAARAYTGKPKIAKIEGAYHGSYDYAEISLDSAPDQWGQDAPQSVPYARGTPDNVLRDVVILPFNDPEQSATLIAQHAHELAAILLDPLPNRVGLIPASAAYLEAIAHGAREAGALLILDEVISFRLGYGGAQSIFGIDPDLTALGKLIGGGFPVGAVAGKREVMSVFDPSSGKPALPHGGTFTANPITMLAGSCALELLDVESFKRLDAIGEAVRQGISEAFKRVGLPGQAVGMGSLVKVHFTDIPPTDYRSVYPDRQASARLQHFNHALLANGILASSYGLIALSTPMTDDDVNHIIQATEASLQAVKANCK